LGEQPGTPAEVVAEQKLSGICSWECYNTMNGGQMQEVQPEKLETIKNQIEVSNLDA